MLWSRESIESIMSFSMGSPGSKVPFIEFCFPPLILPNLQEHQVLTFSGQAGEKLGFLSSVSVYNPASSCWGWFQPDAEENARLLSINKQEHLWRTKNILDHPQLRDVHPKSTLTNKWLEGHAETMAWQVVSSAGSKMRIHLCHGCMSEVCSTKTCVHIMHANIIHTNMCVCCIYLCSSIFI